jgi:hypothetical protein
MKNWRGRPRTPRSLERRSRRLLELPRVLIACEGEKTEPKYFRDLCKSLGLTSAVVEVAGKECGSAPLSVCQYAISRFKEDGGFDRVYCVFDRDAHETFEDAIKLVREHHSKKIKAIPSYPSFEYWVLLHFRYTRASVTAVGGKSSGARMLEMVRQVWAGYEKGAAGICAHLEVDGKIEKAIERAGMARAEAEETGDPNPSTCVDELVHYLRELATQASALGVD